MIDFETAKEYLDLGLSVFPIKIYWNEEKKKFEKQPMVKWIPYQKRLPTLDELHSWFDTPKFNGIGCTTGRLSGIVAIDIDDPDRVNRFPSSCISETISGRQHHIFKWTREIRNAEGINGEPLDFRGDGGFIALPPSSCDGKSYKWIKKDFSSLTPLPQDFLDLIANVEKKAKEPFDHTTAFGAKTGKRNEVLKHAIPSLIYKHDPESAWLYTKALNNTFPEPLPESELRYKFEKIQEFVKNNPPVKTYHFNNSLNSHDSKPKVSWPKPLAKEAYYGPTGELVRFIEPHSEADPAALLINFLTCFGSVVGGKPYFRVEADHHNMRIFEVLVGETSKARKGTSLRHITRLFETIDPEWVKRVQTGLSSGEGLISAVQDEIRKKQPVRERGRVVDYEEVVVEEGVEDKRLLIIEEEFASTLKVMGREGNTLSPVIRRAWDTGNLQSLTKNSPVRATGAHISIIGHITREELLRYLTATETANGFGNRFIWFCVLRSKCLPRGSGIQQVDFAPLIAKLRNAVDFAKQVEEIKWADETGPLWDIVYPDLSEGKPGIVGSMTGRAEAYVTRLACVYALLDLSYKIKPAHLKAALAIWDYAETSVKYIFQGRVGSPLADEIQDLLAKKPNGSASRTEINNSFQRHKSAKQISSALNILRSLGIADYKTDSSAGRSIEIWYLTKSEISEISEKRSYLEILNSHNSLNSQTELEQTQPLESESLLPTLQTLSNEQLIAFYENRRDWLNTNENDPNYEAALKNLEVIEDEGRRREMLYFLNEQEQTNLLEEIFNK